MPKIEISSSQKPLSSTCSCTSKHKRCPLTWWMGGEGQKPFEQSQRMWEARPCQLSAPVSSLHTCCRRPYLVTVKYRGATMPCGSSSVHSARQTDRRPFAHRASITLIRADKLGPASESCSIDTIHLKILMIIYCKWTLCL